MQDPPLQLTFFPADAAGFFSGEADRDLGLASGDALGAMVQVVVERLVWAAAVWARSCGRAREEEAGQAQPKGIHGTGPLSSGPLALHMSSLTLLEPPSALRDHPRRPCSSQPPPPAASPPAQLPALGFSAPPEWRPSRRPRARRPALPPLRRCAAWSLLPATARPQRCAALLPAFPALTHATSFVLSP